MIRAHHPASCSFLLSQPHYKPRHAKSNGRALNLTRPVPSNKSFSFLDENRLFIYTFGQFIHLQEVIRLVEGIPAGPHGVDDVDHKEIEGEDPKKGLFSNMVLTPEKSN